MNFDYGLFFDKTIDCPCLQIIARISRREIRFVVGFWWFKFGAWLEAGPFDFECESCGLRFVNYDGVCPALDCVGQNKVVGDGGHT